jgi:ABC-type uncharacterized transport system substrate-binding protein
MQSCQLRRREFITLLGGVAAWPLGAHAQQPAKPVIGFLSGRSSEESRYLVAAFNDGLRGEDFIEGQNVMIEYRWAEGQNERLPAQAIDLARRQVAVIVAVGGDPSTHAAKAATTRIPIACVFGTDPVQTDLVASLNRPGGNVTGVYPVSHALESKRLALCIISFQRGKQLRCSCTQVVRHPNCSWKKLGMRQLRLSGNFKFSMRLRRVKLIEHSQLSPRAE